MLGLDVGYLVPPPIILCVCIIWFLIHQQIGNHPWDDKLDSLSGTSPEAEAESRLQQQHGLVRGSEASRMEGNREFFSLKHTWSANHGKPPKHCGLWTWWLPFVNLSMARPRSHMTKNKSWKKLASELIKVYWIYWIWFLLALCPAFVETLKGNTHVEPCEEFLRSQTKPTKGTRGRLVWGYFEHLHIPSLMFEFFSVVLQAFLGDKAKGLLTTHAMRIIWIFSIRVFF